MKFVPGNKTGKYLKHTLSQNPKSFTLCMCIRLSRKKNLQVKVRMDEMKKERGKCRRTNPRNSRSPTGSLSTEKQLCYTASYAIMLARFHSRIEIDT